MPRGKFKPQPLSDEEKAARVEAAHATMADQVATMRSSEAWQRYLATAAKFHRYSFRNVLLLYSQAMDRGMELSHVAGFSKWLELDRSVRKGERGLKVFAPILVKDKDAEDEGRKVVGFKLATVFDYSQTDGEPLPMLDRPTLPPGEVPAGLLDTVHAYAAEIGYPIDYGQPHGGKGHCEHDPTQRIVIAEGMAEAEEIHTALHEIGHALLHHPDGERPESREVRETEAESVAHVVASLLGLNLGAVAFDYVAGWAPDLDTVTTVGGRVMDAAKRILAAVETAAEDEAPVKAEVVATATVRKPRREPEFMASYRAEADRRKAQLEAMTSMYPGDVKHAKETGQWKAYTLQEHMKAYGASRAAEMASA